MRTLPLVSFVLSASLVLVAGCGGGAKKSADAPAPAPAGKMSPEAAAEACVKVFTRQRECTDTFIPALVGWRVELDVPAGVAAEDASQGRDALVALAKEEWAASNSDAQLAELCTSVMGSIPADQLGGMLELANQCVATDTCEAFTTCVEPMQRQRLEEQKAAATAPAE